MHGLRVTICMELKGYSANEQSREYKTKTEDEKKNMTGQKRGKPKREKKIGGGARGVGSPWALAHLQREAGGSG